MQENTERQLLLRLLDSMVKGATQPNKMLREAAEMIIYDFEREPSYLKRCFTILDMVLNQQQTPQTQVFKGVILANISRYISKQFTLGNEVRKQSRMELFSTFSVSLSKLCNQQALSNHYLRQLCDTFATMLLCDNNRTLTLNYIGDVGQSMKQQQDKLIANCYLLVSILKASKNDVVMTTKVYAKCGDLIIKYFILLAGDPRILEAGLVRYAFSLVAEQLKTLMKLMDFNKFTPIWSNILRNQNFINTLLKSIQINDREIVSWAMELLTLCFEADDIIKVRVQHMGRIKEKILPNLLESLKNLVHAVDNFELTSPIDFSLLKSSLLFSVICIKPLQNMLFISSKKEEILFNIILPCLKPTQKVRKAIVQHPEEYYNRKSDLNNKQKSQTLECFAAKMLQAMCDWIDGAVTFLCDWAIEIMKTASGTQVKLNQNYLQSKFYKTTEIPAQLQLAILCLTMTSYTYTARKDIVQSLNSTLVSCIPTFFNPANPELYIQFTMLWTYNCDILFQDKDTPILLQRLLQILINNEILPAVRIATCETILDLMSSERYTEVFKAHLSAIMGVLMKAVESPQAKKIFEMIQEMFKLYSQDILKYPAIIQDCLKVIGHRIQTSVGKVAGVDTFTLYCFDWFETLIENINYKTYADEMIQTVAPVYYYYNISSDNPYLDRLIIIANKYMKNTDRCPDCIDPLLPHIQKILSMYEGNQKEVLIMLNNLVGLTKKEQCIGVLLKVCEVNMISILTDDGPTNPAPYLAILQLILSLHFQKVHPQVLQIILGKICNSIQSQYFRRSFKGAHCINLLILMQFMRRNFQSTIVFLNSNNCYQNVMAALYESVDLYQADLPSKIFVVIQMQLLPTSLFDNKYLEICLRYVITLLKMRCQRSKLQAEYLSSSSSNPVSSDEEERPPDTLKQLTRSPYHSIDQIVCFQKLVSEMQKNHEALRYFLTLVNNLPIGLKSFVTKEAMNLAKIEVGQGQKEVRKILRVARNKGDM